MTENQELVKKLGQALIFDNEADDKIKNDPVAVCVVSLVNAMKADFGHKFQSQFSGENAVKIYKRRLYAKLRGLNLKYVVDAYELFVGGNPTPEWPPTIPELMGKIKQAEKEDRQSQENAQEAQKIASLPPPKITCDPLALLAEAKKSSPDNISKDEWLKRKADAYQNLHAVLTIHGHNIRRHIQQGFHNCKVPSCAATGTLSAGTKGGDNFYCSEHYFLAN